MNIETLVSLQNGLNNAPDGVYSKGTQKDPTKIFHSDQICDSLTYCADQDYQALFMPEALAKVISEYTVKKAKELFVSI